MLDGDRVKKACGSTEFARLRARVWRQSETVYRLWHGAIPIGLIATDVAPQLVHGTHNAASLWTFQGRANILRVDPEPKSAMTMSDPQRPPRSDRRPRIGPVDVRVGQALRARRMARGLTLDELAQAVSLTPQQIHKYESAQTRIPASRLNTLSQALRMPLADFFDGTGQVEAPAANSHETLQFDVMRMLRSVSDPDNQRLVLRLLRAIILEVAGR